MLEAEAHTQLLAFLRQEGMAYSPHHLTMTRLVARALRLQRSALMQTGSIVGKYSLSYLTPILLGDWSAIVVAPEAKQQQLLKEDLPQLQAWLQTNKPIYQGECHPHLPTPGIILTSASAWLADRLHQQHNFPPHLPTIIDGADELESWSRQQLTVKLTAQDWYELTAKSPQALELIREVQVKLTKSIFATPPNPYQCCLLEPAAQDTLLQLLQTLDSQQLLTPSFANFWQSWQADTQVLIWAALQRNTGQFTLQITPLELASHLMPIWQEQPVVLIGRFLDWEKEAPIYRANLGLGKMLCLKFAPTKDRGQIQLYLPESLPMPNTPQFQQVLTAKVHTLISLTSQIDRLTVVLVGDVPLKAQIAAVMAADFGSRVQVEKTQLPERGVLITGWEFWWDYQSSFPSPQLLIVATLPIPSLENPLVAARVAYYKSQGQDWFRCYLLPTALRELQRAVMPLRTSQGVVALFDNRVNHRSYGKTILSALEPYAKINYFDPSWFDIWIS